MIRRVLLLALFGTLLLPTAPAAGGPAEWLCSPDTSRGAVPAGFVLEACVDGAGLTARNSLDVPVVVTGRGVEEPVRTSSVGAERETVLRLVREDKVVLLPGDVVRWPIGSDAAALTVSELEPAAAPSIVEVLDPFLPREGPRRVPDAVLQAFADVVEPIDEAVAEREACLDGQNFLGAVACDVTTAAAIATALDVEFSRGVAIEVAPVVLDRGQWAEWGGIGNTDISGNDAVLRQEDVATPDTSTVEPASASRSTRSDPVPQGPASAPAPAVVVPVLQPPATNGYGNGRGKANGHDKWDDWLEGLADWLEDG